MKGKSKKSSEVVTTTINKKFFLTVFFSVLVFLVILSGVAISYGEEIRAAFTKKSNIDISTGYEYYDNYMNFSMVIPGEWAVTNPDSAIIKEEVPKLTNGVLYDVTYHRLSKEVVPVTLVQQSSEDDLSQEERLKKARFITMAVRPSDATHSYTKNLVNLMDHLKGMLESLDYSDVKIHEAFDTRTLKKGSGYDDMQGVLIHASALVSGVTINYTQYIEPVGANLLIFTYGSTNTFKDQLEGLRSLLGYLVFHPGGQFWTPADKEQYIAQGLPTQQSTLTPLDPNHSITMDDDGDAGGHWHEDGTWHSTSGEKGHYHEDGSWHPADTHSDTEDSSLTETFINPDTPAWEVIGGDGNVTVDTDKEGSTENKGGHYHADGTWHPDDKHSDSEPPSSTEAPAVEDLGGHFHEDGSWHPDKVHSGSEDPSLLRKSSN